MMPGARTMKDEGEGSTARETREVGGALQCCEVRSKVLVQPYSHFDTCSTAAFELSFSLFGQQTPFLFGDGKRSRFAITGSLRRPSRSRRM